MRISQGLRAHEDHALSICQATGRLSYTVILTSPRLVCHSAHQGHQGIRFTGRAPRPDPSILPRHQPRVHSAQPHPNG